MDEDAMILGLSLSAFTTVHVVLSLIGIASGFIVVAAMTEGKRAPASTGLFLATTVATSVTAFLFPFDHIDPGLVIGAISLVLLALAVLALYVLGLAGVWRTVYVVTAIMALYLNVFVAVVQAFVKLRFLAVLAPTQTEPPFVAAQGAVLTVFVILGFLAVRRFHPLVMTA